MTVTKATKILRQNNYSVASRSGGTKRVVLWKDNRIVWDKFVKNDELKELAKKVGGLNE